MFKPLYITTTYITNFWHIKVPIVEETPWCQRPCDERTRGLAQTLTLLYAQVIHEGHMCDIMFRNSPNWKNSAFGFNCWQTSNFELMGDLMSKRISAVDFHWLHSKKCWVVSTHVWVKYGQTQPLSLQFGLSKWFVHIWPFLECTWSFYCRNDSKKECLSQNEVEVRVLYCIKPTHTLFGFPQVLSLHQRRKCIPQTSLRWWHAEYKNCKESWRILCQQCSSGIRQIATDVEKGRYALGMIYLMGPVSQDFELMVARYSMTNRYNFNHFTVNLMPQV